MRSALVTRERTLGPQDRGEAGGDARAEAEVYVENRRISQAKCALFARPCSAGGFHRTMRLRATVCPQVRKNFAYTLGVERAGQETVSALFRGVTTASMIGRTFALMTSSMQLVHRALGRWRSRRRARYALALAGGGVIGGMYEVGALAALEERLDSSARAFDIYVGCSAGSVVCSLLAGGVRATEIYQILEDDLDDPINFRRNAVFASDAFRRACGRVGRLIWAFGKSALRGRGSIPDMLARAERDMPPGFFSLDALEQYLRAAYASRGLSNSFAERSRTLLIPAIDLNTAERVVFGVNPLVPNVHDGDGSMRARGVYTIMEQAGRIYSQNLLTLGMATLAMKFPRTAFYLLQPPRTTGLLFGPSMGFEASRTALRYGYASTKEWLDAQDAPLVRHMQLAVA